MSLPLDPVHSQMGTTPTTYAALQPTAQYGFAPPPPPPRTLDARTPASQLSPQGISGAVDQHSRSASFPPPPLQSYASSPLSSRQLPPGASYAPVPAHRPAPSLPPLLTSSTNTAFDAPNGLVNGRTDAYNPPQPARNVSEGRLDVRQLETVTEGSSSGAASASPERRQDERYSEGFQQQRRPLPVPEPPRPGPSSMAGSMISQTGLPPPSHPSAPSSSSLPPAEAYYPPSALTSTSSPYPGPSTHSAPPSAPAHPPPLAVDQRSSFTGIPNGRVPSTRAAVDAAERASNIPSFVPAPAFSAFDRGPYPPHVSPTRPQQSASASGFGAVAGTSEERELLATDANGRSGALSPFGPDGRPGSLAFDLPADMAGVGRNSIIRAASSTSASVSGPGVGAGASPTTLASQHQAQRASPPRPAGSGPKSPQLVEPSLQALQVSAQQAQPSEPFSAPTQAPAPLQPAPPPQPQQPKQQLPPHLVPQPEVCVECMMRDRDMADVDVTTPGVWERDSDAEFDEQMRWEGENPLLANGVAGGESWSGEHAAGSGSTESAGAPGLRARRASGTAYSRESMGGRSSNTHGGAAQARRRLGRGQSLTTGNLKVLTSMNPPAAAHRWRTLQTYLATQIHLLELERQSREAAEREQQARMSVPPPMGTRSRSSSLLSPASLAAEKAALEQEERQARAKAAKTRSRATLADETNRYSSASLLPPASSPISIAPPNPPFASSGASIRSYTAGDQPWLGNQLRRFSSPGLKDASPPKSPAASTSSAGRFGKFARSVTDLRAGPSPRSVSPARTSVGMDDRRTSLWSRFRQSASASVLSFAPSGSMMDMHLGLSQDKHGHLPYAHHAAYETYQAAPYPSMSDSAVARHAEQRERDRAHAHALAMAAEGGEGVEGGKKKKKGIKGFFNKLVGGGKKGHPTSASAPTTPGADLAYGATYDDDELAPPPPLSALVNEPRYHQRSASNSSVDSFGPYTPPLHPANFRSSYTVPMPEPNGYRGGPADRQSILTMGSYTSQRSKQGNGGGAPSIGNGRATIMSMNSYGRPSLDSLREPAPGSLPRLGSPEPVVTIVDNQGEPEVLVDDETGEPTTVSPNAPTAFPPQPRLQKSLPSLPSEAMYQPRFSSEQDGTYPSLPAPNMPYAHYSGSRSAYSLAQVPSRGDDFGADGEYDERRTATTGSGRKGRARARSKVFSFGGFGKKGGKTTPPDAPPVPSPPPSIGGRGNSLDSMMALNQAGVPYETRDTSSFRYVR
ncbi:hypothetical protein JCM10207_005097 [Rhodosporidiobolus poonsookiae]